MKKFILVFLGISLGYLSYCQKHIDSVVVTPSTICVGSSITVKIYNSGYAATDSAYAFLSNAGGTTYTPSNPIYRSVFTTNPLTFSYAIPSGLSGGTYRIFAKDTVTTNQVDTFSNSFTVNILPTVNAGGSVTAICQGATTAALGGSFGGSATSAVWSDGGAGGSFNNNGGSTPNTAMYTASVSSGSPVTLTLTTSGGSCGTVTANKSVTVNLSPTVNAGGSVSAICQGATTAALGGSFGGGATAATWSDGGAGGSFTNNTGSTPSTTTYTASSSSGTPVTLTLTTSGGSCGTTSANKSLTVNPNPTVGAGAAVSAVCQGGTTGSLGGSFGGGATSATWSDGGAGGSFSNNSGSTPSTTTYTASSSSGSPVTLTLTTSGGSCGTTSANKSLTVNPNPTVNAGGSVAAICQNATTAALGGSFGGGATGAVWSDGGAGGTFTNNSGATPGTTTYKASATSASSVTLTLTSTGGSCTAATANKSLTVHANPTVNVGGSVSSLCQGGTTAALGGSFGGEATAAVWSDGGAGGSFTNNTGTTPNTTQYTASVSSGSPVTLTLTTSGGSCGITSANKSVTVIKVPSATITTPSPICATSSVVLTLSSSNTTPALSSYSITSNYPLPTSSVYGPSTTAPTSPLTVSSGVVNPNGITNFTYTITSSPCAVVTASTSVTVHPVPAVSITSAASSICNGSSTTLSGTASPVVAGVTTYKIGTTSGGFDVYGSSASGLLTAPTFPLTISPSATTTYFYTVTNGACSSVISSVTVIVRPIPTAGLTSALNIICNGSSTGITGTVTNSVGGVTTYSITASPGGTLYASSTTSPAFPFIVSPTTTTTYTFTVTNGPCTPVSANTTITVIPSTAGGSLSTGALVCPASPNNTTFTLTGHVGTVQKWQQSTDDGANWTDIANTTTTFTATNINVSTLYRAVVRSGSVCNAVNSATSGVFVNTNPVPNFLNNTVCFNLPPTVFTNSTFAGTTLSASQQTLYNIPGTVNSVTTYAWDFGDTGSGSNTSTLQNPTHAFSKSGSFNVSLTATTNTIIGGVSSSCSNAKTITVIVLAKPTPPVPSSSNPSTVCYKQQGANFKVDTITGLTYLWSSPNTGIIFYAKRKPNTLIGFPATGSPFDIYITAINSGGCRDSSKITISTAGTIPDPPQLILTNNNKTMVCLDNKQTSYQWGYDDKNTFIGTDIAGATLQDYTASGGFDFASKNYYVKLNSGGCSYKVYYNAPTGIRANNGGWKISLQPNPNTGIFILNLEGTAIPNYSCITDMLGKQVSILNLHTGINNIDVHDLSAGIYYLQVINNSGGHRSIKLIINK